MTKQVPIQSITLELDEAQVRALVAIFGFSDDAICEKFGQSHYVKNHKGAFASLRSLIWEKAAPAINNLKPYKP